jgi:hypothetical protein
MNEPGRDTSRDWLWLVAFALWAVVLAWKWPVALSFGDEVAYVAQARLVLQGRLHPLAQDPGFWLTSPRGLVAKFPFLAPLLLAPLFTVHPRLIFVLGPLAGLGLVFAASRVLRAWGHRSIWAAIPLMHPTVTIVARTVMTDLMLAALVVGTWWAARRQRLGWAALLAATATLMKQTGFVIVAGLIAGEVLRERVALRRRDGQVIRRLASLAGGLAAGLAGSVAFNFASNGTPWSAYSYALSYLGTPAFWPRYFPTSAPVYLLSVVLLPPLLVAGAWPLWKRREFGPLIASGGLIAMMCFYFFVDHGRSALETLLLAPRLILPAVAFLLIGYASLAATLWERLMAGRRVPALCAVLPALIAMPISVRHRAWQDTDVRALAAASTAIAAEGGGVLGVTYTAGKSGLLYMGRAVEIESGERPRIVLCGAQYPSYRAPGDPAGGGCDLDGYQKLETDGNNSVLRRKDP